MQIEIEACTYYKDNTIEEQFKKIEEEKNEVEEAMWVYIDSLTKQHKHLAEELADLATACVTMMMIVGMNDIEIKETFKKVNEKNIARGYCK